MVITGTSYRMHDSVIETYFEEIFKHCRWHRVYMVPQPEINCYRDYNRHDNYEHLWTRFVSYATRKAGKTYQCEQYKHIVNSKEAQHIEAAIDAQPHSEGAYRTHHYDTYNKIDANFVVWQSRY